MSKQVGSRYNITVPLRSGRRIVYNSLSGASAVMKADEADAFDKVCAGDLDGVPDQTLTDLTYGGFVVGDDFDELKALEKMYMAHRFDASTATLTIAPTMACNFGCDYCFQGQNKPSESMRPEVQDAIIDLVVRAAPNLKSVGVAWYGGEPLIRRQIIETLSDRLIATCRKRGLKYSGMIVTNGFMLDLEAARSLQARNVTWAQITLDGTPEYHDSRRHLLGGQGSFARIIANLVAIVDEVPITYAVRVNIDDRNHRDIHALLDYMVSAGLANRKNLKVYFAPVEALTEGCHVVQDVTLGKARYGQLEADLYRHGYSVGLTALPYPPRFHGTCGAVRPSGLVILPNGDLHKCWDTVSRPEFKIGTIFKPEEIATNELALKWMRWTPFDNHTCKNCKILPNCAGACAYKFVHAESTRGEAAVLPCPSWKYNIKERLLQRALVQGEIREDEWDPQETGTVPAELCADDVIGGGLPLPANMQALYEEQKRIRLPVVR